MVFSPLLSLCQDLCETTVIYSSCEPGECGRSDGNGPVSV